MTISPSEKIQMVQQIYSLLKLLTDDGALAGIVITDKTYEQFKLLLRDAKIPYTTSGVTLDPNMEHTFVVDGLLVMRGTQSGE